MIKPECLRYPPAIDDTKEENIGKESEKLTQPLIYRRSMTMDEIVTTLNNTTNYAQLSLPNRVHTSQKVHSKSFDDVVEIPFTPTLQLNDNFTSNFIL